MHKDSYFTSFLVGTDVDIHSNRVWYNSKPVTVAVEVMSQGCGREEV